MPYSVIFIDYEDDYKHRYDSGIEISDVEIFRTYEKAEKYVCSEICKRINDYLIDQDINYLNDEIKQYFIFVEDFGIIIKKEYEANYEILNLIHNETMQGEYVDYRFTWELTKIR